MIRSSDQRGRHDARHPQVGRAVGRALRRGLAWPTLALLATLTAGCERGSGSGQPAPDATAATASSASAAARTTSTTPGADSGESTSRRARAALRGLDASGHPQPSDADRCAMCGMKIVDHRDWAGAIETAAGETFYFCGPRCTLGTALASQKFLGIGPEAIGRIRVPEYLRPERSLDAKAALFVVGSDVRGPMGAALLPAATQADADTLVRRHGGRVVRHEEIDLALLRSLKEQGGATAEPPHPAR